MRRLIPLAVLLAAGCATTPRPPETAEERPQPVPQPQQRGDLIGLTAGELIQRFGSPALQIRERQGLKLQFRGAACVLDAYLYPPAGAQGPERVTWVDARLPTGVDTNRQACIAALQRA